MPLVARHVYDAAIADFNKAIRFDSNNALLMTSVKWEARAQELAPAQQKAGVAEHLELYKSGKPYRDEPKK